MKRARTEKTINGAKQPQRVRIEFDCPSAQTVAIAGSFNGWQPQTSPMIALREGRWARELALAPGRYEYRLVVDGRWITDPQAKETVGNPFGSENAILTVAETSVSPNREGAAASELDRGSETGRRVCVGTKVTR